MKKYKQFEISFNPFNVDLISGLLWDLNIEGIQEYDNFLHVYSEGNNIDLNVLNAKGQA